ncbi:TPA: cell division protein FtsK [Listeria monocytogenes]|nr:cell division protein FtsK [Listeria monocytogenes]
MLRRFVEKHLYKHRGRRIHYKTKDILVRAGISIAVPAFFIALFLMLWVFPVLPTLDMPFKLREIPNYLSVLDYQRLLLECLSSLIIALCLVFVCKVVFYKHYTLLKQRQTLARLIIDRKYYDTEQTTKNGSVEWDIDWLNKQAKNELTYFPKIYFQLNEGYLYVRFPTDGRAYQEQFLQLGSVLETAFYSELDSLIREEGYICYKFIYAIARDRLNIKDVHSKNGRLALMKRTIWDFDKLPHMLICGGVGAGKTYTILSVILGLLKGACHKEDITICDPKNADLADLEGIFPNVYHKIGGIIPAVRNFKNDMLARSTEMKEMPNYVTGKNYRYLGLPPKFLIFDEFSAFMEMLDYKEQVEFLSDVRQIALLSRQAGYFLIVGMQRPDAKYLSDGIRDQFHFRLALGRNSDVGYSMMFGDNDKKFTLKEIKGFGYADSGKGVISEFYSPFVDSDFDFIEEFKKVI